MRAREFIGVIAYALVASFLLEKLRWLPWLTAIWPAVLLLPVIYVLARYDRPLSHFVAYLSAGLVAALAGFWLALYAALRSTELHTSALLFAAISVFGEAAYSLPLLAVVVTVVFSMRRNHAEPNTIDRLFYPGAAWKMLVAAFVLLEAYVFGSFTKSCGGLGWGFYGIMFSPALLYSMAGRIGLAVGMVAALIVGGLLPRVLKLSSRTAVSWLVCATIVSLAAGYALTPLADAPCQPV